ncbi:MAG: HNH endonuclease [Candidatus Poribacteria bacterium]|nr:HNH endonuclease [Candidatus Poribacteria bacterium]
MRVDDPLRDAVASRANKRCEYCQYPQEFSDSVLEVEHIVPRSAGGPTELKNLALACSHCNRHKAARQKGTDPQTGTNIRLFNPRIDTWAVHFVLNRETCEIEGKTPVGRTTVEILQMNAEQPILTRQNLIKYKIL